jgi:nucleotide-binding universal stress UspA family protein
MPMTWDAASIGRVVVGVGALPRPPRLIDRALELAGEHKVPLLIVHALDFPAVPGTESASEQARRRRQVKAEIDLALAPLRRRHGRVHLDVVVTHGTPEETLGDVLLGRRDTDRPSYEHLGSLTRHMMRSANVPVVVVPRPLDAAMARPLMSTSQEKGVTPAS